MMLNSRKRSSLRFNLLVNRFINMYFNSFKELIIKESYSLSYFFHSVCDAKQQDVETKEGRVITEFGKYVVLPLILNSHTYRITNE